MGKEIYRIKMHDTWLAEYGWPTGKNGAPTLRFTDQKKLSHTFLGTGADAQTLIEKVQYRCGLRLTLDKESPCERTGLEYIISVDADSGRRIAREYAVDDSVQPRLTNSREEAFRFANRVTARLRAEQILASMRAEQILTAAFRGIKRTIQVHPAAPLYVIGATWSYNCVTPRFLKSWSCPDTIDETDFVLMRETCEPVVPERTTEIVGRVRDAMYRRGLLRPMVAAYALEAEVVDPSGGSTGVLSVGHVSVWINGEQVDSSTVETSQLDPCGFGAWAVEPRVTFYKVINKAGNRILCEGKSPQPYSQPNAYRQTPMRFAHPEAAARAVREAELDPALWDIIPA